MSFSRLMHYEFSMVFNTSREWEIHKDIFNDFLPRTIQQYNVYVSVNNCWWQSNKSMCDTLNNWRHLCFLFNPSHSITCVSSVVLTFSTLSKCQKTVWGPIVNDNSAKRSLVSSSYKRRCQGELFFIKTYNTLDSRMTSSLQIESRESLKKIVNKFKIKQNKM
jgi:hypothetical protein